MGRRSARLRSGGARGLAGSCYLMPAAAAAALGSATTAAALCSAATTTALASSSSTALATTAAAAAGHLRKQGKAARRTFESAERIPTPPPHFACRRACAFVC